MIGSPGADVRASRYLMIAILAILLETIDPPVCGVSGNSKPLSKIGNGVVVQLVVFEESLSLFAHGNTFPRHGPHLLLEKVLPML